MTRRRLFVLCLSAALAVSACSSQGSESAGSAGSAGSATADDGEPSDFSCTAFNGFVCVMYTEPKTHKVADALTEQCSADKGTIGAECSKSGLLGCCVLPQGAIGTSLCFYGGGPFSLDTAQHTCAETPGGIWSSSTGGSGG